MYKRRDVLKTSAVGIAALIPLTTPLGCLAAVSTAGRPSKDLFQSLLHHGFRCMDEDGGVIKLKLVEVREGPEAPGLDQFALVFQEGNSAVGTRQAQAGLYRLYHRETGLVLVHLAPSDTGAGRYTTYFGLFT